MTTRDQVAEIETNTAMIAEASEMVGTIAAHVKALTAIAISDADQETRERLVTELANRLEAEARYLAVRSGTPISEAASATVAEALSR